MKMLVVSKSHGQAINKSIQSIWDVIDAKYSLNHFEGKNHFVGYIPERTGDCTAKGKYFQKVPCILTGPVDKLPSVKERLDIYNGLLVNGIEMGNCALLDLLERTHVEYDIIPDGKF